MTASWTIEELRRLGAAHELQIASRGVGGTLSRWVPNWVVNVGGQIRSVVVTYRRQRVRVISARRSRREEVELYEG